VSDYLPAPNLTDDEWRALDAFRAGEGVDDRAFRRAVQAAAEKLRMSSVLPVATSTTGNGRFRVPQFGALCPFCELGAGRPSGSQTPAEIVHRDDKVMVLVVHRPMGGMLGHLLVIPRRHAETIFDLDAEEEAVLGRAVAQAARLVREVLDPEGVLVQQNNGAAAFQTVPHTHFHVVPKRPGPFPPLEPFRATTTEERNALATQLRERWRA
jgi:diadenosine tetraphosphate (Ap4A) HIT family hydrolase